jgi:hypothetical protein
MGGVPSQPGVGQNLAGLWGGGGFGGLGSPGAVPPIPLGYNQQTGPITPAPPGALAANPGAVGIDPSRTFNYAAPGTTGGPQQTIGPGGQQPGLWDRIMRAVGQGTLPKMPGTTIGAPAGANAAPFTPPPPLPQTQMPAPPGMGAYFRALQNPAAGAGNQGLMAQYMALQQLMRGG